MASSPLGCQLFDPHPRCGCGVHYQGDSGPYRAIVVNQPRALNNAEFGPALTALIVDKSPDGVIGPLDFRFLSVREFGTIYEGLLESELSVAETPLTTDALPSPAVPGSFPDNTLRQRYHAPLCRATQRGLHPSGHLWCLGVYGGRYVRYEHSPRRPLLLSLSPAWGSPQRGAGLPRHASHRLR